MPSGRFFGMLWRFFPKYEMRIPNYEFVYLTLFPSSSILFALTRSGRTGRFIRKRVLVPSPNVQTLNPPHYGQPNITSDQADL